MIGRIAFRRLASSVGAPPGVLAGGMVVVAAAVAAVGRWALPSAADSPTADVLLFAASLIIFFAAWGFGIFAAHAAEATYRGLRFFRVRATGVRALWFGARMPVAVASGLLAVAMAPAGVTLISRSAGYGWVHALVALGLLLASGASLGRLNYALAGLVTNALRSASLQLSVAFMIWLAWAVAGVALLTWSMRQGGEGMVPLLRLGPLVWPIALWLILTADLWAYLAMIGLTLLLVAAASRVRPVDDSARRSARIRRRFDPGRAPLITRLLMVRIWRNARCREWLIVAAFFGACYCLAVLYLDARGSVQVDLWALRALVAELGLAFGVLVRGLSHRRRPVERRWLVTPLAHALAAFWAVLGLGTLATSPVLVGIAVEGAGLDAVAGYAAIVVLQGGLAVGIGFALVPVTGSGGGELLATAAYFIVGAAAIALLNLIQPVWMDLVAAGLVAVAALAVAVQFESRHRRAVARTLRTE